MNTFHSLAHRRQYWQEIVAEWQQSGLTQAEFSRRRAVADKSLSYWVRRLSRGKDPVRLPAVVQKEPVHGNLPQPVTFVSLPTGFGHLDSKKTDSEKLVLRVGSKYRVIIPGDFRPETLSKILRVLEGRA